MARISYVDPDDVPEEKRSLLDSLSDTDAEPSIEHPLDGGTLNVYRAMGRNFQVLEAFREYGSAVWQSSNLTPHQRETVILTTAVHAGMAYEWHQHVRVALDEGLTPEQILAVSRQEYDVLEEELALLAEYAGAFVAGEVDDSLHERLSASFDDATVVGIGMLSGLYLGLGRFLDAVAVETEVPFVGWDLENL